VIQLLLERALKMGDRLGAAPEAHLFAEIISSCKASPARITRHANFQSDPIADMEARHTFANGLDHPGRLMPQS
jgi:hypothetical protein